MIDNIDIYINSKCNLECRTCFLGDEYFRRDHQMTTDTLRAILKWAANKGVQDVAILGGEPTLHPNISEIIALPRQFGFSRVRLITNGNKLFRKSFFKYAEYLDLVYISLDSTNSSANDSVRGFGSHCDSMAAIEMLRANNFPFVITCTISKPTVSQLPEILRFADDCGCVILNLHWLSPVGRAKSKDLILSVKEWMECRDIVAKFEPKRSSLQIDIQTAFIKKSSDNPEALGMCLVRSQQNLQFMPDGRVVACGLMADDYLYYAYHWSNGTLSERGGETELSMCKNFKANGCPLRQGVLPHLRIATNSDIPVCIYHR